LQTTPTGDKKFLWDATNRMTSSLMSDVNLQHNIYDAQGQRALKGSGSVMTITPNSLPTYDEVNREQYTLYPSPNLVVDASGQVTKHYFAGSERVASQLAGPIDSYVSDSALDLSEINPGSNLVMRQDDDMQDVMDKFEIASFTFDAPPTPDDCSSYGSGCLYFFHKDHLGSSAFLTNSDGDPYQFLLYLPFGETMVDQKAETDGFDAPYLYTGQELDKETGLYYYGARYYDPVISNFLSVDPHADRYPSWTPYHYVHNNPIIMVDPDGRDAIVTIKGSTITVSSKIYIYGSGASKSTASLMQSNIMGAWGADPTTGKGWQYTDASSGKTYDVVFDVQVELYNPKDASDEPGFFSGKNNPFNRDNYIEVDNASKRSFVRGGDEGVWRGKGRGGKTLAADDSALLAYHVLLVRSCRPTRVMRLASGKWRQIEK